MKRFVMILRENSVRISIPKRIKGSVSGTSTCNFTFEESSIFLLTSLWNRKGFSRGWIIDE